MPKRYILKQMDPNGGAQFQMGENRPFERNLLGLSTLGMKWNTSLIKQIRTAADYENPNADAMGAVNPGMLTDDDAFLRAHNSISGQNDYIAYYDQTYLMRRDFLRKFALQPEIDYVLETIADEVIVNDDSHYFAYPDTKQLRSILKADDGKKIVDLINSSYRRVYHAFNFNESNDAWGYVKKLLTEGFLAFEIVYSDSNDEKIAKNIIAFKELDPTTMKPEIRTEENVEYKVWVVNKGDKNKERVLLDTNVIYISWSKANIPSHLSYCERLIRPFNTLRTLENSRLIWNVQNAQKRIKFVVPVGGESEQRYQTRLRQLEAYYKEDINIDNMSGEVTINGQPKFSFARNFFFPSKDGATTEISEIDVAGHDLNSTDALKWFWQRFMIETELPKDRFNMLFDGNSAPYVPDTNNMTREENRYRLFIGRIRDIFKEMLIKPTWIQACLQMPKIADNMVIKNALGLRFVEENIFTLAREAANLRMGADIIQTLSNVKGADGKPTFATKFLTQKFLNINDDDWALNKKLLEEEAAEAERAQSQQAAEAPAMGGGGFDFGGGGGGFDFGGGAAEPMDVEAPAAEPEAAPEPTPEA